MDAQNTPFFRDFTVLDDSKKYTPFPRNLEHTWLPLFMLSEGTRMRLHSISRLGIVDMDLVNLEIVLWSAMGKVRTSVTHIRSRLITFYHRFLI